MSDKQGLVPPPTVTTATVVQPVTVVQARPMFGELPIVATCPLGGHQVTTNVHYKVGMMVWLVAAILVLVGLFFVAWIPFFIDSLKDVVHTCPEDGTVIGVYERLKF